MKPVLFHPSATTELAEAIEWYEQRLQGLGIDLEFKVEKAIQKIQENPMGCSPHKKTGCRKYHVERFPYLIFFTELQDYIWILAIAHGCRSPGYWQKRLE